MHSQCSKEHYDKIEPLCIVFSLAGMCGVANVKLNSVFITLHQYLTQHLYGHDTAISKIYGKEPPNTTDSPKE